MPSQEKTKHLGLNQWQGNEYVKRQDFVDDNQIIDSAVETITEEVEAIQSDIYSPQYSDQKTTVVPVISMGNTVDGKLKYTLKGRTLTNLVAYGNFKDGTSGWTPTNSSLSVTNQILSIPGSGASRWPQAYATTKAQFTIGKKYFLRLRARVTNPDAESISLMFYDNSGMYLAGKAEVLSPIANQWYEAYAIITPTIDQGAPSRLYCRHTYPDAATANGKVMEVQEVIALDLEQYPDLQGLTADEINAQIPGYIDGMQSIENVKVVSIGKNLFDGNLERGTLNSNGQPIESNVSTRTSFIPVDSTKQYLKPLLQDNTYVVNGLRCYGYNKHFLGLGGLRDVLTFEVGTKYIRFTIRRFDSAELTNFDLEKIIQSFQLEQGTTPTPYEPYQESTMFLPVPLRQLPNGVADSIDSDGNYVRRTNEIILKNSDIFALNTTSTNFDFLRVKKPTDHTGYNVTTQLSGSAKIESFRTKNWTVFDTSENVYMLAGWTLTEYCITFPKGTYANLAAAQAALAGTKVIYELETPVTSKVNIPPLISFKDGTLMFQNRRKYILRADDINNIATSPINVDYAMVPKSTLTNYIYPNIVSRGSINVNGMNEEYNVPDNVINIGKYSTSTANMSIAFILPKGTTLAQAREQLAGLEIEYETIPYPLPQIEYTYPLNLAAGQQGNTEMIAQLNSVFQDLGEGGEYGTATSAEVMEGYTLGTEKGVIDGKMLNIGAVTNTITTQGGQYTIPQGYHRGSGKVTASFPNLIPENVKEGINIGGILGSAKTYSIDFQCNKKEIGSGDYELGRFILPSSWKFLYLEASADQGSNFVIINKSLFHSNYEKREGSYDGILVLSDVSVSDNNVLDFRIYNKHKNSQLVNYRCYAVI